MVLSSVTNLPATSPSTKDRKDFREWTFPKSNGSQPAPVSHASPLPYDSNRSTGPVHGHSSSISPVKQKNSATRSRRDSKFTSKDFRHRSNASLVASPPTVTIPLSSSGPVLNPPAKFTASTSNSRGVAPSVALDTPESVSTSRTRPLDVARMIYLNVRRRSASDLFHTVVFLTCLVMFTLALLGHGEQSRTTSLASMQTTSMAEAHVIDVKIPEAFLPLGNSETSDGEEQVLVQATDAIAESRNQEPTESMAQQTNQRGASVGDSGIFVDAVEGEDKQGDSVEQATADSEDVGTNDHEGGSDSEGGEDPAAEGDMDYEREVAAARRRALSRRQRMRNSGEARDNTFDPKLETISEQAGTGRMVKKARMLA